MTPQPGSRNDCTVYRACGIAEQLADRPVMADGGYQGNGSDLPEWKEDLNATHRKVRARVEHVLSRMKNFKILRDYRRAASMLAHTLSGIANLHDIILTE